VEEVLARHKATLLKVDHPTNSLEDLFLQTVTESKAHPGRRFSPGEAPGSKPSTNGGPGAADRTPAGAASDS
jgi:ABC-2 type transport system ATP-binding protein